MYRSFTSAAALLSLLPTALAAGTAHVVNNCGFDVYYASVAQSAGAAMQKLPSSGYSEPYSKPNNGISIKISTSIDGPVTQFEFTWASPNINYDISHINGNPFAQYGSSLVPSMVGASGYPTCVALSCPAGTTTCADAYNQPDDIQTRVCPEDSDLTFTLCPGGAPANPPSGQSSAQGSSAATSKTAAGPSAPQASTPAAAPTSFQTYTTPAANSPVASSAPNQPPVASTPAQSPPADQPTAAAPQTSAPAATQGSWGGGWGHHHNTRRAHMHRFRS